MRAIRSFLFLGAVLLCPLLIFCQSGWETYGGDAGAQRYSRARQITRENVGSLKAAWTFHTHALDVARHGTKMASFEATPIFWNRTLYLTSPLDEVFAVNAANGQKLWSFDPKPVLLGGDNITTSRGVALWHGAGNGTCEHRVFVATLDARVYALDAKTGAVCVDFGESGSVNLKKEVGAKDTELYEITSAPTVVGDVVVLGSSIPDGIRANELRGTVHALDARTGRILWKWDPIGSWAMTQPGSMRTGAGNVWSTISADPVLGLIYLPTGSASPEYYGGLRRGDNRDANSVVALQVKTGKRVWGFQLIHHDLWDYDTAAEPLLFQWRGTTPAVAVASKMGQIFVLDRRTGVPLLPVEERAVPKSDIPGEDASPTQPFSSVDAAGPLDLRAAAGEDLNRTAEEKSDCQQELTERRYEGPFTPPSLQGSLQFPGSIGGVNWGGMAYDPASQLLYANDNSDIYEVDLIPREQIERSPNRREKVVQKVRRLTGHTRFLLGLSVVVLVAGSLLPRKAAPRMIVGLLVAAIVLLLPLHRWLESKDVNGGKTGLQRHTNAYRGDVYAPQLGTPYWWHVKALSDRLGRPCTKLPWGSLVAINMSTGKQTFRVPHGPDVKGQHTGSLSVSGPIVTAGGVVFSAGTTAPVLYAYDAASGKRLAELPLPVTAQATPMSYELDGKQYVVVSAGGHGPLGLPQGDALVAFALP